MSKTKKREPWIRSRHRFVRNLAYLILKPVVSLKYHARIERFDNKDRRPYLIISNHQTAFDQFFIGMIFSGAVYYVASEDLFSMGWISKLLKWAVAPIPIKKQATDVRAVLTIERIAKEGGTIAIFPEGNRTFSGKTSYINPAIAGLIQHVKLPVALVRIEGGYGVQPRWSDKVRKGKMHAGVTKVIEPQEYAKMSREELFKIIEEELYVDEGRSDGSFKSSVKAEYLERTAYVCPFCGLSEFESSGNLIECKRCHRKIEYLEDKSLRGVGFDFPFRFYGEWYDYQESFVNGLNPLDYTDKPMYVDLSSISKVILYKNKVLLRKEARVSLYGDRIVIDEFGSNPLTLGFDDIHAISVLGKNKLNIYCGKTLYQLKSGRRFNAVKYLNIFYRYKNIKKGDANGNFLGL